MFSARKVDEVDDGHDDNRGQDGLGDKLQRGGEDIQGEEDDEGGEEAGDGGAAATVHIHCGAGEGAWEWGGEGGKHVERKWERGKRWEREGRDVGRREVEKRGGKVESV